jgi:hypothetical protein
MAVSKRGAGGGCCADTAGALAAIAASARSVAAKPIPRIKVSAFDVGKMSWVSETPGKARHERSWRRPRKVREYIDEFTLAATPILPCAELRPDR